MYSSTSFFIQVANLCIEICGYNDEDSACLDDLKRVFCHHEVSRDAIAVHRVVVCASSRFEVPTDVSLRWVSPCLGVAGGMPRHRWPLFDKIFARKKERPKYSGTCDMFCYYDVHSQRDYFIPENGEWRIEHDAKEHVTYVFSDGHNEMSDGLPSMLINVIGSQYGCYLLFASCVAVEGEALLFMGNSGVGKTTLCLELIKQGASYIGDDLVLVYLTEGRAMVGSLLFPMKCYVDGVYTHKKKIDVASQFSQRPPLHVPLHSMYLLQPGNAVNAELYFKPMPDGTMFEKMLKFTNRANTNADAHHFVDVVSFICGSVPCYYFSYGVNNKISLSFFANND